MLEIVPQKNAAVPVPLPTGPKAITHILAGPNAQSRDRPHSIPDYFYICFLHFPVVEQTPSQAPQIDFPGMDPGEEFRFYFHKHRIRLVRHAGFLLLWIVAFLAVLYVSNVASTENEFTRQVFIVLLCVLFVIPQIAFLIKLYHHFLAMVIVTDKKVHQFKQTLIAVDRHQIIDLWMLQEIGKSQRGIIQNMLGFGSLILEGQTTQVRLHFVPNIDNIRDQILSLREAARMRISPMQTEQAADVPQPLVGGEWLGASKRS